MILGRAARLMVEKHLKRLPVVDANGKLLGILGRLDVLNAIAAVHLPEWHPEARAFGAEASAIATASVIRTWRRSPRDRATPTEFYADFVKTERVRHLRFIRSLYGLRLEIEEEENTAYDPIVAAHPQLPLYQKISSAFPAASSRRRFISTASSNEEM